MRNMKHERPIGGEHRIGLAELRRIRHQEAERIAGTHPGKHIAAPVEKIVHLRDLQLPLDGPHGRMLVHVTHHLRERFLVNQRVIVQ